MSYIEFFGTILNILCVWLVARNNILTWPIGIVAVVLFAFLFYQIQLYSDFFEQIYFIITGFYGWWVWIKLREKKKQNNVNESKITRLTLLGKIKTVVIVILGTVAMGYFMSNIHNYFPSLFPIPASFPYLDAFTTIMSFTAQLLMAHKKIENWYLWIVVDVIGIGLYYVKGVVFVAILYMIFLGIATKGYFNWRRYGNEKKL
jgi:nicotinamide mononucleotide transporter